LYLWGGLAVFAGFTLLDASELVERAVHHEEFDVVRESTGLYLDILNVFVRIVRILATNDDSRRRRGRQDNNN
jgi:FtsH-binding integral membrane protein